jgi:hypothetical protein
MEYFSIDFDFLFEDIYGGFVADFFRVLEAYGLSFNGGFRDGAGKTLSELIDIYQEQLLAQTEFRDKYYQIFFSLEGFSDLRAYWSVSCRGARFTIIIPEEDFVDTTAAGLPRNTAKKNRKAMDKIKELAVHVWEKTNVRCIQTAWEWSDVPCMYKDIRDQFAWPQVEPFAILPASDYPAMTATITKSLSKNGIVVEDDSEWCCAMWKLV